MADHMCGITAKAKMCALSFKTIKGFKIGWFS